MKINNLYKKFSEKIQKNPEMPLVDVLKGDQDTKLILKMAEDWEIDLENVEKWIRTPEYEKHYKVALSFTEIAHEVLQKVEDFVGQKLIGEIRLSPSLMRFDGFARYDSGNHTVWFGVDHPDADLDYLKVLLAHELSHVYRDHQPGVWGFLNKPLKEVKRQEYLDNMSAEEHIISEGLATLFSQAIYPEVDLKVHHYYTNDEMKWCFENKEKIEKSILKCLSTKEQNVWEFYQDDLIEPGSPSRVQYFWGALKLRQWIEQNAKNSEDYGKFLLSAHGMSAESLKDCIYKNP